MSENKMGRPSKEIKKSIVTLRLDDDVIDEIDTICSQFSKQIGFEVSRMQLIRKLISMGLIAYKDQIMK